MDPVEQSIALEAEGRVAKMILPAGLHCICGESIEVENAWQAENEAALTAFYEAHEPCRERIHRGLPDYTKDTQ